MKDDVLSVRDSAARLGLSERRVRALIESGGLDAERIGRSWAIRKRDLDDFVVLERGSGRPLSAENAWALLASLAAVKPDWVRPDVLSRLRRQRRDASWLVPVLERGEPRSHRFSWWLPEEDRVSLVDYALVRSGLSASNAARHLDLVAPSNEPLDAYASRDVIDQIERAFQPEPSAEDPNVILRVPTNPWVLRDGDEAPLSVVAADILSHRDERVRRAAKRALEELAHADS